MGTVTKLLGLSDRAAWSRRPQVTGVRRLLSPIRFNTLGLALFALLVVSLLWFTRTPDELKTELPKSAGASFAVKAPAKVAQMPPSNPVRPPMAVKQPLLVAASNPAPTGESEKAASVAARPEENHAATQKPARPKQPVEGETTKKLLAEGIAAFNARSYYEAEGAFEQVLRKTGDKGQIARAEFYLGRCAYQRGDVDEAISRARRALSRTDNPEWRIYLGMFHMTNKDQESAVREWMRVYCGTAVSGVLKDKMSGLLDDKDIPAGDRVCPKTGEPQGVARSRGQ